MCFVYRPSDPSTSAFPIPYREGTVKVTFTGFRGTSDLHAWMLITAVETHMANAEVNWRGIIITLWWRYDEVKSIRRLLSLTADWVPELTLNYSLPDCYEDRVQHCSLQWSWTTVIGLTWHKHTTLWRSASLQWLKTDEGCEWTISIDSKIGWAVCDDVKLLERPFVCNDR